MSSTADAVGNFTALCAVCAVCCTLQSRPAQLCHLLPTTRLRGTQQRALAKPTVAPAQLPVPRQPVVPAIQPPVWGQTAGTSPAAASQRRVRLLQQIHWVPSATDSTALRVRTRRYLASVSLRALPMRQAPPIQPRALTPTPGTSPGTAHVSEWSRAGFVQYYSQFCQIIFAPALSQLEVA